jgi:predicted transposase YdaD
MKLARQKELLRFFQWLAGYTADELPDNLLGLMLLYALHTDSDLDAKKIYHTLSSNPDLEKNAMSVAEKLKAEGRVEGRVEGRIEGRDEGLLIGKIQAFEEFLEKVETPRENLESMALEKLESLHRSLHREYEIRFKRN